MTQKKGKTWKRYGNKVPSTKDKCFYCEHRLWDSNRTTDHIVPKSKGGILSNDNKVHACKRCNAFKKDHDVDTFYGMVRFLVQEKEAEFKQSMKYYTTIMKNIEQMKKHKSKDEKTKESIPSNKDRS